MGEQLSFFETRRDPFTCKHAIGMFGGYTECNLKMAQGEQSEPVLTNCRDSVAGEPPKCVYEPHDNSKATGERRKAWLQAHKQKKEDE